MKSPCLERVAGHRHRARRIVDPQRARARDAGLAHAARDHRRMRGHAAARGEDALGRVHAMDVFGRGLDAHQDDLAALRFECFGLVGREHDLAGGCARRRRQAGRDHLALGLWIDGRMQKLFEPGGIDARHRFLAGDHAFAGELDRDLERRLRGALAGAGLQHPQLALLDREFEILHVAVVVLEHALDAAKLRERLRQRFLHRRLVGACRLARSFGDLLRRADAGDNVLALRIDQEFAVELLLAGRGIAGEGDAGGRGLAHIAEHHRLHVDRGAPAFGNGVQAPIGDGALVHPRAEHRADRAPELLMRILRKRLAVLLLEPLLVASHQLDPVVGGEIGVERVAVAVLVVVEDVLEQVVFDAEHHVGIHGDEAPVAVIGEAAVARRFRHGLHGLVVEAEIEHGVHHAGHRRARARAHRDQQRVRLVAETLAGDAADLRQRRRHLALELFRIAVGVGVIVGADLGGDGEARRYRQAEIGHLGKPRALAAQEVAHARRAPRPCRRRRHRPTSPCRVTLRRL